MECVGTTAFGGSQPLVACVTHIDYHSANIAQQITAVANRANGYYSGNHVIVGGDFNVAPDNSALNAMYRSAYSRSGFGFFNEADAPSGLSRSSGRCAGCSTNEATVCGGQKYPCGYLKQYYPYDKIDFIFLGAGDFASFTADATYALHSDHTPLWASTAMY
jgi:endonuclease/exonuclease/phosphatase family metal-dependent hydrolase